MTPSPSGCGGTSWVNVQQGMLAKGDYAAALAMFDSENTTNDMLFKEYGVARWHGTENLTGKHIIVVHQWGLGDCVMAARYLQLLKAGSISVAVPDPLGRIVARDGLNVFGAVIPVECFDYYVPIMQLIGYFDHIPRPPYLSAAPSLAVGDKQWRLGIAWQGNPKHLRDATRSIEPAASFSNCCRAAAMPSSTVCKTGITKQHARLASSLRFIATSRKWLPWPRRWTRSLSLIPRCRTWPGRWH